LPLKSIEQFPDLFTQLKILNGGQYQHRIKINLKLNKMEGAFLNPKNIHFIWSVPKNGKNEGEIENDPKNIHLIGIFPSNIKNNIT